MSAAGGPNFGSGEARLRSRAPAPPSFAHRLRQNCPRCRSLGPVRRQASALLLGTCVLLFERRRLGVGRVLVFDIQGWITLFLGGLLALITLFTSYSHAHVPFLGAIALDQQIGVLLLAALVPALVGDAQLATRCRLRAERDRVRKAEDRARAEDEAAQERERTARRAQRQDQCNLVQLRHQLEPSESNAQRVRDVISLLEEYGGFS